MSPHVVANVSRGDCRTECRYCSCKALSEYMFTQPVTCPNLSRKKVILLFSRQINPKIQVNSPTAQEIPVSHAIRDSVISA